MSELITLADMTLPERRCLTASDAIAGGRPDRIDYLHSALCQVGFPRRQVDARTFARQSGAVSLLVEAGSLWDGSQWVEQPLPYGVVPRLVMVYLVSQAVRTRCRVVELGDSMRQFLKVLGLQTNGGSRGGYTVLRKQLASLAACRLALGMYAGSSVVTVDAKPVKRFGAWLPDDLCQPVLEPGTIELSEEFFNSLIACAVPLDPRALAALKHSALALDVYAWLAHRLCRVTATGGTRLSWMNLREQFGNEYRSSRDFKRELRKTLHQVKAVYPGARVVEVHGGLRLYRSHPPINRHLS